VIGDKAPRRIRRYANRKLYDVESKRYVTLENLAGRVAAGDEVEVRDQKTGEDLTSLTLAQILLEGLKEKTARIPRQVLVRLVRLSAGPASAWGDWTGPREAAGRAREEVEKIVGRLLTRGRLSLDEALHLRQEVSRAVHGIVAEAQTGIEHGVRSLLGSPGPHRSRSAKARPRETRKEARLKKSAPGTGRVGKKRTTA
jgi:polyhydroxyalkanoate synthesis repressor PhaR